MAPGIPDMIQSELDSVDLRVNKTFKIRPGLLSKFAHVETSSIQKCLHPAIVLLAGRAFGYTNEKIIYLASAVQLIYVASNVHFRIPDDNEHEEGFDPRDGARFPVLVGDYLYGKYFVELCEGEILEFLEPLSQIICEMNYGALLRKKNAGQSISDLELAMKIVEKETALLMEGAVRYAGILAGATPAETAVLSDFGRSLGMAYGILERNLGPAMAEEYFNSAETALLKFPAGEAREGFSELVNKLRSGEIAVPLKKTGHSFNTASGEPDQFSVSSHFGDKNEEYIQSIFSAIAKKYDVINTVLSLNQDKYWRKFAVQQAKIKAGGYALDVCCGTGMMTVELAKKVGAEGHIVGLDLNSEMLDIAQKNLHSSGYRGIIEYVHGNAMEIPFADNTFDCATIGFGLRNIPDIKKTIREMTRVVKPGCPIVCLEFSKPNVPLFKQVYDLYFDKFIPFLGKIGVRADGPYRYLHKAWGQFPDQKQLRDEFTRQGLENSNYYELTGGVISVHVGFKPNVNSVTSVAATKE